MTSRKKEKSYSTFEVLQKMMSFCAYQERSHKQVRSKLYEFQLKTDEIEEIIFQLISENFLNEERFALSAVRGKFNIKKWGKKKIVSFLRANEVSEANISLALKVIDNEDYTQTIQKLITQKANTISETDIFKKKAKIAQYMVQKGYENDIIWEEIEDLIK